MMTWESLKGVWGAATSLFSTVGPYLRKAKAEREAGQNPYSVSPSFSDEQFEDALRTLGAVSADDSTLKRILTSLKSLYVRPEHFSSPYIRDWLSLPEVQKALRAMTCADIANDSIPLAEQEIAQAAYTKISGENNALARHFVFAAVKFIKASVYGGIKDPALGALCDSSFKGVFTRLDALKKQGLESAILNNAALVEHHGADAEAELEAILMRRGGSGSNSIAELYQLADKLESHGIYSGAPIRIRHLVLDWIVRLEASQDNLEGAESALQKLSTERIAPSLSAQAWHLVAKGDVDAALRLLREEDSADAKSTIFAILHAKQGPQAAMAFFDELETRTPESFTAVGWGKIALELAKLGDVERGLSILDALPENIFQKWSLLWFVSGILNSCMIVPAILRKNMLDDITPGPQHTLEGKEPDGWRAKAIISFEKCANLAISIGYTALAKRCSFWLCWLRLADPRTRLDARRELAEAMASGSEAVDFMSLALAIDLKFNTAPLWRHLSRMEKLGGLPAAELQAKLQLLLSEKRFSDLAAYIETEWVNLSRVFPEDFLSGRLIEAYAETLECERAEAMLNEKLSDLHPSDARQLELLIQNRRGNDPTNQAWENYKESNEFTDLLQLVSALKANGRWSDLTPFALKLFEHEPNAKNALLYTECLRRSTVRGHEVIEFLKEHPDLVEQDPELRATRAWALFYAGDLLESKSLNDRLLAERDDANDINLAINLSIRLGEWERFPALLESIWSRRDIFSAETLLILAKLTSGSTKERAIDLIMHCHDRYQNDPGVLLKMSSVAMSIGKDDIAIPLIHKAAQLADGDKSMIWQAHYSEMLEVLGSIADHGRKVSELFRTAQIPIHMAAHEFNIPLCKMLVAIPKNNKEEPDARMRNPVPAFAGNHPPASLGGVASVALDLSSAYVLNALNLLPHLFNSLDIVYLSPRFFEALYHERENIRFHQPSRILAAKPLLQMVHQGKLKIVPVKESGELADEVGQEIAELLLAARRDGGMLVHAGRIWRAAAFMEEEARLGEFGRYVIGPSAVAEMLYAEGEITESTRNQAIDYLRKVSGIEEHGLALAPEVPIILDQVCAGYLSEAGILRELVNSNRQVYICNSAVEEWQALVDSEQYSESITESLESIRKIIRDGVNRNKIKFTRESQKHIDGRLTTTCYALFDIIENSGCVDAVCIDDRALHLKRYTQEGTERNTNLICSIDIINMLYSRSIISRQERHQLFHKLREGCVASVPIDIDSVFDELIKCHATQDGNITESAVLRVLREYISRLHTSGLLCTAQDVEFLLRLSRDGFDIIKKIWEDSTSEIADIHARANWAFDYIIPDAELVLRPIAGGKCKHEELTAARILGALAVDGISGHKKEQYGQWIDSKFVGAHRPASRGTIDSVAALIHTHIEELPAEIEDEIERCGAPGSNECNDANNTRQTGD